MKRLIEYLWFTFVATPEEKIAVFREKLRAINGDEHECLMSDCCTPDGLTNKNV